MHQTRKSSGGPCRSIWEDRSYGHWTWFLRAAVQCHVRRLVLVDLQATSRPPAVVGISAPRTYPGPGPHSPRLPLGPTRLPV